MNRNSFPDASLVSVLVNQDPSAEVKMSTELKPTQSESTKVWHPKVLTYNGFDATRRSVAGPVTPK